MSEFDNSQIREGGKLKAIYFIEGDQNQVPLVLNQKPIIKSTTAINWAITRSRINLLERDFAFSDVLARLIMPKIKIISTEPSAKTKSQLNEDISMCGILSVYKGVRHKNIFSACKLQILQHKPNLTGEIC